MLFRPASRAALARLPALRPPLTRWALVSLGLLGLLGAGCRSVRLGGGAAVASAPPLVTAPAVPLAAAVPADVVVEYYQISEG